jgi:hypothetical protein
MNRFVVAAVTQGQEWRAVRTRTIQRSPKDVRTWDAVDGGGGFIVDRVINILEKAR